MARGRILSLPQDTTMELMNKILAMCSSEERTFSEIFSDDFVNGLRGEYSERLVKDYIMSMCKLGFLDKTTVTHIRFSTTKRGMALLKGKK